MRKFKGITLVFCAIIGASLIVFAQPPEGWEFVGENFLISAAGPVYYPKIAFGDNKYFIVWYSNDSNIRGQFVSTDGTAIGSTFIINTQSYSAGGSVAYHEGSGRWFVAWTDDRATPGTPDIYGRILESDGTPVGSDFEIWSGEFRSQFAWVVAVPSGFFVVWEAWTGGATDTQEIYGRTVSTAGGLGAVAVISNASDTQQNPSAVYSAEYDRILAVWEDFRYDAVEPFTDIDIYGQLLDGSGNIIGSNFMIHDAGDSQNTARAAYSEEDNSFLVVFDDQRFTAAREITAQKVGIDGSLLGPVIYVNDVDWGWDEFPAIAYNANIDKYLTVWTTCADVYAKIFDSDSAKIGPDLVLSNAPNDQFAIGVAAGPGSTFLAAWQDLRNGSPSQLWGQIVSGPLASYLPDLYIKNKGESDANYVLKDRYYCGTFIAFQTKEQSTTNSAVYYISIEQDGANNDDTISVTGTGNGSTGGGNWTVKYYEVASESDSGIDRTSEIVSTGYGYALASGSKQLIRAEVTPDTNVISGTSYTITVTATSTINSWKKDIVRAITTAIEGEETIAGSSGESGGNRHHKHSAWYKPQDWKCGLLGIEPLILIVIVRFMRRRRVKEPK